MVLKGKVFKFGDNINTDWIISGRYKFSITDMKELSKYMFEDIRPGFYEELTPKKSIIVAGENFGMGSSREQAPWVIKEAGVNCVVAKSFARIFFRNAINTGLVIVELDKSSGIAEGDSLDVDLAKGVIKNLSKGKTYKTHAFPKFLQEIVKQGGLLKWITKKERR
jgi:3-isopropylmalate/(R)-2-methylmalate dehydratase small subunit